MHTTTLSLSPSLASKARRTLTALTTGLSDIYQHWLRARQARATAYAMSLLDDRVLHDIGLGRSELLSAAAEAHGQTERQRRLAVLDTAQPR